MAPLASVDASPRGHGQQRVAPVVFMNHPAGHVAQVHEVSFGVYFPAAQEEHLVVSCLSLKVPGIHLRHALAPLAFPYTPLGHARHASVSILPRLEFPYFPAAQSVH